MAIRILIELLSQKGRLVNYTFFRGVAFALIALTIVLTRAEGQENSIAWQSQPGEAVKIAQTENKLIVVFVTSDACTYCQKLKKETLSHKSVINKIVGRYVPLRINANVQRDFVKRLGIVSYPTILVTKPSGDIVQSVSGYVTSTKLSSLLQKESTRFAESKKTTKTR